MNPLASAFVTASAPSLAAGSTLVFFGDSITDCGRDRAAATSLGNGYVASVASRLGFRHPDPDRIIYNRGNSGNRVGDLAARVDHDVVAPAPAIVSILIGINDTWRRFDRHEPTSTAAFLDGYRALLSRIQEKTSTHLVLLEPFLLPVPADRKTWREDLDPKIGVARELAVEFNATFVPLDGLFAAAATRAPAAYWLPDGVHPSSAGHALIADAWLAATGLA